VCVVGMCSGNADIVGRPSGVEPDITCPPGTVVAKNKKGRSVADCCLAPVVTGKCTGNSHAWEPDVVCPAG
jgi:hypothetical protein